MNTKSILSCRLIRIQNRVLSVTPRRILAVTGHSSSFNTMEEYTALPNWIPLVAFLLFAYKAYEYMIEYSLALDQIQKLAEKTTDKLDLLDRNYEISQIKQKLAIQKSLDEVQKCQNEILKLETSIRDREDKENKAFQVANRTRDEIKGNLRTIFDSIQKLSQNKNGTAPPPPRSLPLSATGSSNNDTSWFEIQKM